jgi:1,2-phenylacetyl-CoA epoxidase PaaB subunit
MKAFNIEFEFTSSKAYGDNYKLYATVEAKNAEQALNIAHIVGFKQFGARFNDNCIDWRIKND